ncbi:glycoside hydrolase family 32 protein [Faecalibaculum rodentium]|uniref:glycoside hydrolase family 32 protein n=1 Tax=Faecalibaculum rodentium TaxID=1702221 RepID=UPI001C3E5174|nr:GH32 C-terminal domain-containing protein [Faecalibaculum rodentium]
MESTQQTYFDKVSRAGRNPTSLRLTYHLEPEYGLLNDPVGLIYFKGRYHVFFQWNSHAKDHSSKEWGHFSSPDLLHWTWHESPLAPDQDYDRNGVYSGSSICVNGRLYAYYTGNRKENGSRTVRQCLATSEDGIRFKKAGPILDTPAFVTSHFRDPRVICTENGMDMLIGAQNLRKQGMILRYHSTQGIQWTYEGICGLSEKSSMIECPDLISMPDHDVLLYCLQNRDPVTDECLDSTSVYRVLHKGQPEPLDLDAQWKRLDAGFDSFASQSLITPDGRILLFSWMNRLDPAQEQRMAEAGKSIHCLSLPRELSVKDGKLMQAPARELHSLFSRHPLPPEPFPFLKGRSWMAEVTDPARGFTLAINRKEIQLNWSPSQQLFTLFRWNWAQNQWDERSATVRTLRKVQIYLDTSSIEVFLNDGEEVFSARVFPTSNDTSIRLDQLDAEELRICPAVSGRFSLKKAFTEHKNESRAVTGTGKERNS